MMAAADCWAVQGVTSHDARFSGRRAPLRAQSSSAGFEAFWGRHYSLLPIPKTTTYTPTPLGPASRLSGAEVDRTQRECELTTCPRQGEFALRGGEMQFMPRRKLRADR